ncbi:hypothetical protein [Microvirga calopogonii]|uniref:hypothetical protein n=1 Tax=Microvirga calopogonii TaxID=2078013 RepID=UPI000E0D8A7B|nr:hypothetical protein [Microvirga calopogonii]
MKPTFLPPLALLLLTTTPSLALTDADRDAAIKVAKAHTLDGYIQCGKEMGRPVVLDPEPMDLNGDGVEEVMITARHEDGGAGCFGRVGVSKTLMIKTKSGEWKANLGYLSDPITVMPEKSGGFPDLELGGPGFCHPIWRWNGAEYDLYRRCVDGKLVMAPDFKSAVPGTKASAAAPTKAARYEDLMIWKEDIVYLHNGSMMHVNKGAGEIRYYEPKSSISGTVQQGTVLFRGEFKNAPGLEARGIAEGTAYVFKKGCEPAPYPVSGTYNSYSITLKGAAPKRAKDSCAILEATKSSPHSVLKFETPSDY